MSDKNPLEEFKEAEISLKDSRKQNELDLLHRWKSEGQQPQHLTPLIKAFAPVFTQKIKQWKAPSVPEPAFHAELLKHFVKALDTYDPSRGAALATHVENGLKKAIRFNANYQNMARIPEGQIKHITPIKGAINELKDTYGRDPTNSEIADHLGMSEKHVTRIRMGLRADIPDSAFESAPEDSMKQIGRDHEVLSLLHTALQPHELPVFNHIFGREGHKQVDGTNDLAKMLKMNPSQVSRIKSSILKKYDEYK